MKRASFYKTAAILIVAIVALLISCRNDKSEDDVVAMYGCPEQVFDTTGED